MIYCPSSFPPLTWFRCRIVVVHWCSPVNSDKHYEHSDFQCRKIRRIQEFGRIIDYLVLITRALSHSRHSYSFVQIFHYSDYRGNTYNPNIIRITYVILYYRNIREGVCATTGRSFVTIEINGSFVTRAGHTDRQIFIHLYVYKFIITLNVEWNFSLHRMTLYWSIFNRRCEWFVFSVRPTEIKVLDRWRKFQSL